MFGRVGMDRLGWPGSVGYLSGVGGVGEWVGGLEWVEKVVVGSVDGWSSGWGWCVFCVG